MCLRVRFPHRTLNPVKPQPCNGTGAGVCLGGLARALMQTLALTCSRVALVVFLVTGYGCGARPEASRDAQSTNRPGLGPPFQRVRVPAVAGLFYPGDPAALSRIIDGLLAKAPD